MQEQKTCRDMTLICRFHDGNSRSEREKVRPWYRFGFCYIHVQSCTYVFSYRDKHQPDFSRSSDQNSFLYLVLSLYLIPKTSHCVRVSLLTLFIYVLFNSPVSRHISTIFHVYVYVLAEFPKALSHWRQVMWPWTSSCAVKAALAFPRRPHAQGRGSCGSWGFLVRRVMTTVVTEPIMDKGNHLQMALFLG